MNITQLWNSYHLDMKRFVFSKVKNEQLTNDLVQETFIKAYSKIDTIIDDKKVKSWLFSIARNTTLDYFRKSQLTVPLLDYDTKDEFWENKEHSPEDCLPGIIKNLPKKYRDPLFLADIKGMKQAKVAEQLQLPLSTIKSQIQRGRKLIKQGYIDCCDYSENDKGELVGEVKPKENCKVCG
ncbi:sigma-70 family RNA polymerase sigma factor [Pseudofulvibacter geojedonensis]|uniref:Sigma-70 family RNA polymerase sigma factor n=1 Tax=Pseudofulvibacter geojedonensis TaxID=1123758 RepID=A0ABW3I3S7_9FLAO